MLGAVLAGVAALAGCGDASRPAPTPKPPPTAPAAAVEVVVRVDGKEAARVDGTRLAEQPRLGELARVALGAATIHQLDAIGRGGARLATEARRHPGQEPRLYLDDQGRPAFAWFRRAADDGTLGTPAQGLVDVATIEITTVTAPAPAAQVASITIVVDGTPHALTSTDLDALPRLKTSGRGRRNMGWPLLDLVRHVAPGATPTRVEVDGDAGVVVLDAARLADAADPPMLKQNRRGTLNLRSVQGPRVEAVGTVRVTTAAK